MTRTAASRLAALVVCLALVAGTAGATRPIGVASVPPFVQKLLSQSAVRVSSYRAVRRLSAENRRFKRSGWIEALTEFDADRGFRYSIVASGGSEYIHRKVLLPILEGERKALADGEPERAALSLDNYRFGDPTAAPDGLVRMSIAPLRRDTLLVTGRIALTIEADLVSVEGRLVKNPSFWTRRVDVVRRYARINGVRVPVETTSTAEVFIAGTSTFAMCYDYEHVNGAPVASRTSCS